MNFFFFLLFIVNLLC